MVHRGRGCEADCLRDLAHRRRVAALGAPVADKFKDALGSLLVLLGHGLDHTERMFSCQERPESTPMTVDGALLTDYAVRTIWAIVVIVVAWLIARGVRRTTMRMLARSRAQANVTILLGNLAQVLVILLGILGVLAIYTRDAFGWILTSFSVIGLVVGLSLQDILKNFFAGIWGLVERPFRIGDTIDVSGNSGVVEEIAFRTTMLKTADGRQ